MLSFPVILLRLSLALILGACIGLERESREHEAGMRTNALISLGCALFTIISAIGFSDMLSLAHVQVDPTRIASYVIAGIGFLGGGVIFVRQDKERIKGLTTAAAIWVVAAIGMACGAGLLWVAVLVTAFALIILIGLRFVEHILLPNCVPDVHSIHLEIREPQKQIVHMIHDICTEHHLRVEKIETHVGQESEMVKVVCRVEDGGDMVAVVDALRSLPGACGVSTSLQGVREEYSFAKDHSKED